MPSKRPAIRWPIGATTAIRIGTISTMRRPISSQKRPTRLLVSMALPSNLNLLSFDGTLRPDQENRARGPPDHPLGHTPHHHPFQAGPSMCPKNDQVGFHLFGRFGNLPEWNHFLKDRMRLHPLLINLSDERDQLLLLLFFQRPKPFEGARPGGARLGGNLVRECFIGMKQLEIRPEIFSQENGI